MAENQLAAEYHTHEKARLFLLPREAKNDCLESLEKGEREMTSKHFEISHEDYAAMQEEIEQLRDTCKKQREALELCRIYFETRTQEPSYYEHFRTASKAAEECLK